MLPAKKTTPDASSVRYSWLRPLELGVSACLGLAVALCLWPTRHWGVAQDSPIFHYVVFLMSRGFAPYRDIIEMNMPGTYMNEWAVMHLFGMGDLAWRVYDLLLMIIASVAAWIILRPWGRFAGFYAAAMIALYHIGQGRTNVGERDYYMAVLLLVGCAFLFYALRSRRPWGMVFFAICFGWAAAIKPTVVPFAFVPLLLAVVVLRRRRMAMGPYIAWALAGAVIPGVIVLAFLSHYQAGPAFFYLLGLSLYDHANGNFALYQLVLRWLPWAFYPLGIGFIALAIPWPRARRFELATLLATFLFGIASYVYQGKGFEYHASTAMLLLIVLTAALAGSRDPRYAAVVLAIAAILPIAHITFLTVRHGNTSFTHYRDSLTADLTTLGGPALSGHIQCLDWTDTQLYGTEGCIEVLYRQRLVPSTGFIYDFFLFPTHPAPITAAMQQRFLDTLNSSPPKYIVVTSVEEGAERDFAKLGRWPAFDQWLNERYELKIAKHPEGRTAYRIYVLKP